MVPTRITIFHMFWLIGMIGIAIWVVKYARTYGWPTTLGIGVAAAIAFLFVFAILMSFIWHANMRRIERMTTPQLWEYVRGTDWNFNQTMALLHLGGRNEDISSMLPRILAMLESESELERVYGWDAFRLVFTERVQELEDYDPRESAAVCRVKLKKVQQ